MINNNINNYIKIADVIDKKEIININNLDGLSDKAKFNYIKIKLMIKRSSGLSINNIFQINNITTKNG